MMLFLTNRLIMKAKHKRLIQEQLETTLSRISNARDVQRPVKGWLRAIREALGMSGKQFARGLRLPELLLWKRMKYQDL